MLIYNFQKEFVGIDEKDLTTLGFSNLSELRSEAADFADLFVKTPGYIHNFKHVHWIDFITCAESNDESKVIINVNNKNYRCVLNITTAFLVDNPSSKAYMINLNHLRELTHEESERIAGDIIQRDNIEPYPDPEPQAIFNTPSEEIEDEVSVVDAYDTPLDIPMEDNEPLDLIIEDDFDDTVPTEIETSFEDNLLEEPLLEDPFDTPSAFDEKPNFDEKLDISFDTQEEIEEVQEEVLSVEPLPSVSKENFNNGYVYDPAVASHELGLPVDLIEEFIQDFIDQAKEFKAELYKAIDEGDLDNLKILSHKLKGVAANLRVEDALEALTIVNTSNDINVVRDNLDLFYKIIAKQAGETIAVEAPKKEEKIEPTSSYEELPEIELLEENLEEKIEINMFEDEDLYSDPIEIVEEIEEVASIDNIDSAEDEIEELSIKLEVEPESELEVEPEQGLIEAEKEPIIELHAVAYSKEATAHEIGVDIESFNTLYEDYINEASEIVATLKDANAESNFALCKSEAIKLKGMSENMRIQELSSYLDVLTQQDESQSFSDTIATIESILMKLSKVGV
jgi:HPt (histidine-containing phosphotransfer) domain-containing protein